MARTNVEDDWFIDIEGCRANLIRVVAGLPKDPEHEADGIALDAWRTAQRFWKKGRGLIPEDVWARRGLEPMLTAGLAERRPEGIYVKGTEEQNDWLLNRSNAARKGGKESAKSRKKNLGTAIPENARNLPKQTFGSTEAEPKQTFEDTEAPTEPSALLRSTPLYSRKNKILPIWDETDPLAKVFTHLSATQKYDQIFDAKKDRKTIEAHMEHYGLSVLDMEQVAYELRHWADGPNAKGIKSPRGLLATFVKRHAEREKAQPTKPKGEKMPVITSMEELKRLQRGEG